MFGGEDGVTALLDLPDGAGERVEAAEEVEIHASNALFSDVFWAAIAGGIEAIHGANQADNSSGDQIVKFYIRQTTMESACQQFHLEKMTKDLMVAVGVQGRLGIAEIAAYVPPSVRGNGPGG